MALSFFTLPKEEKKLDAGKQGEEPATMQSEESRKAAEPDQERPVKPGLSRGGKKFIQSADKAARPRGRPRKYAERRIQSCIYLSESNLEALHQIQRENPDFTISGFINRLLEQALKKTPRGY